MLMRCAVMGCWIQIIIITGRMFPGGVLERVAWSLVSSYIKSFCQVLSDQRCDWIMWKNEVQKKVLFVWTILWTWQNDLLTNRRHITSCLIERCKRINVCSHTLNNKGAKRNSLKQCDRQTIFGSQKKHSVDQSLRAKFLNGRTRT